MNRDSSDSSQQQMLRCLPSLLLLSSSGESGSAAGSSALACSALRFVAPAAAVSAAAAFSVLLPDSPGTFIPNLSSTPVTAPQPVLLIAITAESVTAVSLFPSLFIVILFMVNNIFWVFYHRFVHSKTAHPLLQMRRL